MDYDRGLSKCLFLVIICAWIGWTSADDVEYRTVETSLGKIRGLRRISVLNKYEFFAFKGIYYAQNPSGKLRFKPPVPVEPWAPETIDAFEHTPTCIRPDIQPFSDDAPQSEDCLSLNVFVPAAASEDNKVGVLFYIHGGGYNIMSGDEFLLGPDYLIEENIIIVTMNYRLGVLGFLSLNTPEYSGNMGLKDQQMALKFVYDHIGSFGGDNKQITIAGYSAGAASSHFHILNKESRQYINNAFLMSGSVANYWAMSDEDDHTDFAFNMAAELGEARTSFTGLINFLTTAPVDKLRSIGMFASTFFNTWFFKMAPVIERSDAIKPFLLKHPFEQYKDEEINITVMFSNTNLELVSFYNAYPILYPKRLKKMHKNFTMVLPFQHLRIDPESDDYADLVQDVRDFYFGEKRVGLKTSFEYQKMISVSNFDYATFVSIKRHIQQSKGKVYSLRFAVNSTLNNIKRHFSDKSEYSGHTDDVCYAFTCYGAPYYLEILRDPRSEESRISLRTISNMVQIITNFVKYGNPNHNNEVMDGFKPVQCFDINVLEITNNGLELSINPNKKDVEFWEDLERKARTMEQRIPNRKYVHY